MVEQYIYDSTQFMPGNMGATLRATGRYPIIANRQWDSLTNAENFVKLNDSEGGTAIPGIILSVINDGDNNGVYYVESIGENGKLIKLNDDKSNDFVWRESLE